MSTSAARFFHVETDAEFAAAFPVIVQLRPHLTLESFRERVRKQHSQGYRLLALESGGRVRSLGGYRLLDYLWVGRAMYVDDLVTDEASRSQRFGDAIFAELKRIAEADHCIELHLDSGLHRAHAHRFYFRQRMAVEDFHFVLKLTPPAK